MTTTIGKRRAKVGARIGKRRRRQVAVAKNLAAGMNPTEALVEAGYSKTTAQKRAYQVVRQPAIQSILTESCERILSKRQMDFDAILEPLFDSLHAKIIVKNSQAMTAKEVDLPDHDIRMAASDRLMNLYRGKGGQNEEEQQERPRILFQVNFIDTPIVQDAKPVFSSPPSQSVSPVPRVTFVKSGKV